MAEHGHSGHEAHGGSEGFSPWKHAAFTKFARKALEVVGIGVGAMVLAPTILCAAAAVLPAYMLVPTLPAGMPAAIGLLGSGMYAQRLMEKSKKGGHGPETPHH